MKKIYLLLLFACFFIGNAQINWRRSSATTNYPSWMGTGNTERGMAALGDKMYVVSRNGGAKIKVINGVNGNDLADVSDYTNVSGGTFALSDVEVSTNGAILASNLTISTNSDAFKIYKWDSETAVPSVYITYQNTDPADNLRLGDCFTVTGDITGNAVIMAGGQVAGTSGATSVHKVVRWIVTGGVLGAPTVITLGAFGLSSNNLVATPETISANPDFFVNSTGRTVFKCNANGTFTGDSLTGVVALSSSDTKYFEVGLKKYIAAYTYGTNAEFVRLVDVTFGIGAGSTVALTQTLGAVSNSNGTGGLGIKTIPDLVDGTNNTITIYALATNNGISGTTLINNGAVVNLLLSTKDYLEAHNAAKVFPNPATNEFNIVIDTNLDSEAKAFVYDILGRELKTVKIKSNIQTISIEDLKVGQYLVKVINGKNNTTTKLLKK